MTNPVSIALNGMNAAAARVGVAADNIARAGTSAQDPLEAADMITDIVDLKSAEHAYSANAAVMRVAGEMQDELLKAFDETV